MQGALVLRFGAACLCAAVSSACGSSKSVGDTLAPSSTITLTALAIAFNTPAVGASVQATATATFSNGSTSAVASGFGTDTPTIATVSASGSVTGVAIGDVTIFVDYQGMRATKRVRVLPGYGGTFVGSYTVTGCVATGSFVSTDPEENMCSIFANGVVGGIAVQNTPSADLTTLTGLFQLGQLVGSGSGAVSSSGVLAYSGAIIIGTERMDFRNFVATSPTPGRMAGSFEMVFTATAPVGTANVTATNLDLTRQSATIASFTGLVSGRSSGRRPFAAQVLRGLQLIR